MKCSATQCGFRVNRLKEDRCEGVDRVSAIGPGKPYRRIPAGSTGETTAGRADCVGAITGTGLGTATGTGGAATGTRGAGAASFTGDGGDREGALLGGREKIRALSDAPAAADVAATMARVVFDMPGTGVERSASICPARVKVRRPRAFLQQVPY